MAAGAGLGLAGLVGYGLNDKDKEVHKPETPHVRSIDSPKTGLKPVAFKSLEEYTGSDAHRIFVYACDESNINTKFMPYIENGQQKGWIAKVLLPASDTAPLTKDIFEHQYETLVRLARQEKPELEWKWVAKARSHPYKGYEKMRVIVLYAPVKVGER